MKNRIAFVSIKPRADRYVQIGEFAAKEAAKLKAKDWLKRTSEKGIHARIHVSGKGIFIVYLKKPKGLKLPVPKEFTI